MESQTLEKEVSFAFPAEILKHAEENGEFHIVGYAATSDFDLQGDIITQDALKASSLDLLKNSTVLLNHEAKQPIGKVTKVEFDDHGLLIDALISKSEPDIIQKIKEGVLNKFSIRGHVLEREREFMPDLDRVVNVIRKMTLVEVSLVSVPANPEARAIGWYISKALKESDEKAKSQDGTNPQGGDPMPNDNKGKKDTPPDDNLKKDQAPNKPDGDKKDEGNPTPPAPEPKNPNPTPPAPAPTPPPNPAPAPQPQETVEEAKKNLLQALKSQLEPVFMRLSQLIEMGGEPAGMAKEIWMSLKDLLGEAKDPMPAAATPKGISKDDVEKMISDQVRKQVDSVIESIPTLRKGIIQKDAGNDDVKKAFESLTPEQKLRVALAMKES